MNLLSKISELISPNDIQSGIEHAIDGRGIFDPSGFFTDNQQQEAKDRLQKYDKLKNVYGKTGFNSVNADGDQELVINYNRAILNKSVDWLFGKEWSLETVAGNEAITERITELLDDNNILVKSWKNGHVGAITGDAYWVVELDGENGNYDIRIQYLKPQFVHPIFHPIDTEKIIAVMIQYPVETSLEFANRYNLPANNVTLFSQIMTEDMIYEYNDSTQVGAYENIYGQIPVFHAQNLMNGFKWFGDSDLEDTWIINDLRSETLNKQKRILDYHSNPTTIGTGVASDSLKKVDNSVWTVKNPEAKFYNLEMKSDMKATNTYLTDLKDSLLELSNTPGNSLGSSDEKISNTSAAALELKYMCLLEKTRRKRATYGRALLGASKLMANLLVAQEPSLLGKLKEPEKFDKFTVKFANPLPRDMQEVISLEKEKMESGLQSELGALKEINEKNIESKIVEILADKREKLLTETEKARAINGGVPAVHSVWTGSQGLRANKSDLSQKEDELTLTLLKQLTEASEVETEEETKEDNNAE